MSLPSFNDPRRKQFGRGIRFANVPGGKSTNAQQLNGKGQVFHVSTVIGANMSHADFFSDTSGVVQSRRRSNFRQVPAAVQHYETKSSDRFGNPITPGVGQYPPGFQFVNIDPGVWNTVTPQNVNYPTSRYAGIQITGSIWKMGGLDATGTPSSGFEFYLTSSGVWQTGSSMPGAKSGGASALLPNGDIIILGGSGNLGAVDLTSSFHYNQVTQVWSVTPLQSGSIVPRQNHQLAVLNDGRVFAPGGTGLLSGTAPFTGSELLIPSGTGGVYGNPLNEYWTGSAGIPIYPFNREGYTLTKLADGSVLLLGGRDPIDLQPTAHALRYVPSNYQLPGSNGTWIVEPSMSFARHGHSAVLLDDGKVLVAGGNSGPGSNLAGRLPWPMGAAFGAQNAIADVEIFSPGPAVSPDSGWSGSISTVTVGPYTGSDGGVYTRSTLVYTGSLVYGQGSWAYVGQMRRRRAHFALLPLRLDGHEGRVLAVGGVDVQTYLSSSEIFDYEYKTWTEVTPMQLPAARMQAFYLGSSPSTVPYIAMVPGGETTGTLPNALANSQTYQTTG